MKLYGTENSSHVIELTTNDVENQKAFSRGNTVSFLFAVKEPLGTLLKIHVGHDGSGENPSWFLNEITITDIEAHSRCTFPCYRWIALELEDGNTTIELYARNGDKYHGFKKEFNSARICGLADDHLWLSIAAKHPNDYFTRVQRVTCCFFFLFWGMLTSAIFYIGSSDNTQTVQVGPLKITSREIVVSIFTTLTAFPPSFLVIFMFRRSRRSRMANDESKNEPGNKLFQLPHFCIYIAWFVCIFGSLAAAVAVIFFSLQWGGETSTRWLSSIFLAIIEDVFVSQPIKIVAVSVVLALIFTSKRNQQNNDCSDAGESLYSGESQILFYICKDEIERQRKCRVTERKTNAFIRDMVFSCVFLVLLSVVCYGDKSEHRYHMVKATRDGFNKLHKVRISLNLHEQPCSLRTLDFPA